MSNVGVIALKEFGSFLKGGVGCCFCRFLFC